MADGPRSSPPGPADGRPDPFDLRYGPVVVVHAGDPRARSQAAACAKACRDRGIGVEVVPAADVATRQIVHFICLVVVLPMQADGAVEPLDRFVTVISRYRRDRRHGLDELLAGRCEWWRVGVIQVIGPRALMGHRRIRAVVRREAVCVEHLAGPGEQAVDVLAPYSGMQRAYRGPDEDYTPDHVVQSALRTLRHWGLTDISEIPLLREGIDRRRAYYENPDLTAMYRPVNGMPYNRLDFLLFDVPHVPTSMGHKAWTENGARAVRDTLESLRMLVPTVSRPAGHRKDAQADFRMFYLHLRVVHEHLNRLPEASWPQL